MIIGGQTMENIFAKVDIMEYAKTNGNESAYGLVLLIGPDGFEDYAVYEELLDRFDPNLEVTP